MTIDVATTTKNFIRFFKDHPVTFARSPDSTVMTVAGKRYTYNDLNALDKLFDTSKVLTYDLVQWWKSPPEEKVEWFVNFVEGTYRQEALDIRKNRVARKEKLSANGKSNLVLPDADYIFDHLQPLRFLGDARKEAAWRFWDTKKGQLTEYDYHSVQVALRSAGVDKESIDGFMNRIIHGKELYDPHGRYGLTLDETSNAVYWVNQYVMSEWRHLLVNPGLPDEIDKLMRHLFPKEECREFVYTWIYHSLKSRCGTYLYLCGGQASGKNTLANVIAALHGSHNTSNPKQDSIYGRFNYYLKNKRFVFFDEFNCGKREDKDTLKRIINSRVQVEGKNRDQEDIIIHASYFIANNSLEAIGIDPVDRRFSVPDVSHDSIIRAYGPEFINNLFAKLEDPYYVAQFGFWILAEFNTPKWRNEEPYQRSRFEEIVAATARPGISETLNRVLRREQDEYDYYEEKDSFKRTHKGQHYPNINDWLHFFRNVKRDGQPLGEVDGKTLFTPREDYRVRRDA